MSFSEYLPKGPFAIAGKKSLGEASFPFFRLSQLATIAVFLGRAWQHLRWDAPYRDLLWDEKWMGAIVSFLGYPDWQSYVTDPANDLRVQLLIKGIGWFYVLCALVALLIIRTGRAGRWIMRIGGATLILLAALYMKEKFFFFGQFLEYTLQWSAPFFLITFSRRMAVTDRTIFLLKLAIAFTFTCHGLYAVGYSPRPELFLTMVINILGVDNNTAVQFLNLAGLLDFIGSAALFLPWKKARMGAVAYLCFWGVMTTIARPWAFVHWEFLASGLTQWLHESIYRFPHFLMPLALLIYWWQQSRQPEETNTLASK